MLDFRSTAHRFAQLRDVVRPDLVVCTRRINATQGLDAVLLSAGKPDGNPEQLLPAKLPLGLIADYIATSGRTGLPRLKLSAQNVLGPQIEKIIDGGEKWAWGVAPSV